MFCKRPALLVIMPVLISISSPSTDAKGNETPTTGETQDSLRYSPGEQTGRLGPYLGEEPPGLTPKLFAPGLISTAGHYEMDLSFTRDGRECYIGRDGVMLVSKLEKEGWTAPEAAPFRFESFGAKVLTTVDGRRMILSGRDGLAVSSRTENGWTEPEVFMPGMGMSITDDGTVYTSWIHKPSGEWRLFRSRYVDGRYSDPEEIVLGFRSESAQGRPRAEATHPQIAPDGSFVIFESRQPDGYGDRDFYISFRNPDDTWGVAVNLGSEVNCPSQNARARLSPDGKYLFFNRFDDIYWVSVEYLYRFKTTAGSDSDSSAPILKTDPE